MNKTPAPLSYAERGLLDRLRHTGKDDWPHFRTQDLITECDKIRHVRRLVAGLETKHYLRRWQIGLGAGNGVAWDWQLYPAGDAPQ